jgi:aspartate-semialdehyde dehydrogenase
LCPRAGSLLPFIDKMMDDGSGRSKEEWKGNYETNKILGTRVKPVIVDGTCVRVGSLRCHSQAITIKLRRDVPMDEIMAAISANNEWVKVSTALFTGAEKLSPYIYQSIM